MSWKRGIAGVFVLGLALASAACVCRGGVNNPPRSSSLDGKRFSATLTMGAEHVPDTLNFADGTFESSVCRNAGFARSAYSAAPAGDGTSFAVECDSPTMGHNSWHGTVRGDRIEGTCVRTPLDGGAPLRSTFEGSLAH